MTFPAFNNVLVFTPTQRNEIEQFVSYLFGYLSAQHKDDGAHSAITADSLALATPSPIRAGNISGDLIPTADNTQRLGAYQGSPAVTTRFWKELYVGTTVGLGIGSSGGLNPVAVPAWTLALGGTSVTWKPAQTGQSVVFKNASGTSTVTISPDSLLGIYLSVTAGMSAGSGYFERNRLVKLGEWQSVSYDAGNFTASAGTWTVDSGDQRAFAYTLVGKTLTLQTTLVGTSLSSTPATLLLAIPDGFVTAKAMSAVWAVFDNSGSVAVPVLAFFDAGATQIRLRRLDGANFAASTDNTSVYGSITLEIS